MENTYHNIQINEREELTLASLHAAILVMCQKYAEQMNSNDNALVDYSQKKAYLEKAGLINSQTYKNILDYEKKHAKDVYLSKCKCVFPNSMFMDLEDFKALCIKYGLVCGNINDYIGEIPDANLKEIMSAIDDINKHKDIQLNINKGYTTFSKI